MKTKRTLDSKEWKVEARRTQKLLDNTTVDHLAQRPRAEQDARLWGAFSALPTLCRSLLRVLLADPAPSYAEVSAALDMPVGSIGPRRQRCLQRLRNVFEQPGIDDGSCEA